MEYLILGFLAYFSPSVVATIRRHQATLAIEVLNLFLGWTFVGWVIALVWACTPVQRRVRVDPVEQYGPADRLLDWWDGRREPRSARPLPPMIELRRAAPLREVNETELDYEIRLAALRSRGLID